MSQIEYAQIRLKELKHACINCHKSMKGYYQQLYFNQELHIKQLKQNINL
jgi:formate-dependent nitrite reductase cytochrome c552 subunit